MVGESESFQHAFRQFLLVVFFEVVDDSGVQVVGLSSSVACYTKALGKCLSTSELWPPNPKLQSAA
jgi:hypothetical protein